MKAGLDLVTIVAVSRFLLYLSHGVLPKVSNKVTFGRWGSDSAPKSFEI